MTSAVQRAADLLGTRARHGVPLGPLTTYRVGGDVALMVTIDHDDDVDAVTTAVAGSGVDVVIVGRGSNLLVADDGVDALAVTLGDVGERLEIDATTVRVGASVSLPVLARRAVAAGLTGLEWAVGVPGTVGGGVRMNAGGHGSDIAATLVRADVVDLRSGERKWVVADALGLRFRGSDVADHHLVVAADFALQSGDRARGEAELAEIVRWRREHQPGGQNAGSVFVNPIPGQVSAGELIDAAGLRGLRHGTAEVSTKHANFIQADDGGVAADVVALMLDVRAAVARHSGIWLRSELRLVGFSPDVMARLGATTP
jgi:UDP-N-acetylmuramate dehydrogenase